MVWVHVLVAADRYSAASAVLIHITEAPPQLSKMINVIVYEGQTGLILKFGKFSREVDPGLTNVNLYVQLVVISDKQIERKIAIR